MRQNVITVGLRIDVDTFRGTNQGVPRLLELLHKHNIKASFFFTLGPDNMGRHLWRLLKPTFLFKMLRSKAASLYGWSILFAGTFWPGRNIVNSLSAIIKATQQDGHEVGLHAWDHHKWQTYVETMSSAEIKHEIQKGFEALHAVIDKAPVCSAAAGWKCTEQVLLEKEKFAFEYNSDCRGQSIFRPLIGNNLCTPQIPVTLPTYDELIGRNGITNDNYNDVLIDKILLQPFNVLTIHAEVEGIICADMFDAFLTKASNLHIKFVPLGQLLPKLEDIPAGKIRIDSLPGREGTMCLQDDKSIGWKQGR